MLDSSSSDIEIVGQQRVLKLDPSDEHFLELSSWFSISRIWIQSLKIDNQIEQKNKIGL